MKKSILTLILLSFLTGCTSSIATLISTGTWYGLREYQTRTCKPLPGMKSTCKTEENNTELVKETPKNFKEKLKKEKDTEYSF